MVSIEYLVLGTECNLVDGRSLWVIGRVYNRLIVNGNEVLMFDGGFWSMVIMVDDSGLW